MRGALKDRGAVVKGTAVDVGQGKHQLGDVTGGSVVVEGPCAEN